MKASTSPGLFAVIVSVEPSGVIAVSTHGAPGLMV
jgi:hypothetical protein